MPPKRAAATQTAKENAPAAKATTKKTKTTTTVTKKTTAKAAAPKKTAAAKKAAAAKDDSDKENSVAGAKRKREEDEEEEEQEELADEKQVNGTRPLVKRAKTTKMKPRSPAPKKAKAAPKPKPEPKKKPLGKVINEAPTKRPRINHNLSGIVQVACGGMHVAALTKDNKILTWGVNDQGALGRDTTWDGGLRDADAESDSEDEDDTGLNPKESTPGEIDTTDVPEGTVWVQVVASDSATFALTATGQSNEGILGFTRNVLIQKTPALITQLSKIKQLAVGSNHVLALDEKNKRDENGALFPASIGTLPGRAKAAKLACGSYHCFIIDTKGRVIGWGLNNYAELASRPKPAPMAASSLRPAAVGHPSGSFTEENTIFDEKDKPRILVQPAVVPDIEGKIVHVAAGTDHSFAITEDGKTPTLIDNSAIRDRKIIFAGAGGQYSILGAEPKE
ncbi:regulator of chromosome condensation 1/beta-lactamase-inhibitor protein II [Neurospora crassa]|nr:regulator of chromosome condensation 1/beta-lactamase-inhibitor protein II [Neurospora crassa]